MKMQNIGTFLFFAACCYSCGAQKSLLPSAAPSAKMPTAWSSSTKPTTRPSAAQSKTPTNRPSAVPTKKPTTTLPTVPLCRTIGPNQGCCTAGGFGSDQTLGSVCLTASVTTIADHAFVAYNNVSSAKYTPSSISSLFIPSAVTAIGNYAFQGTNLTSLTFNEPVNSIGTQAFQGSHYLTTVTFKKNVGTIGARAFASNPMLTIMIFNGAVGTISDRAFDGTFLTTLTFDGSVSNIGDGAFVGSHLASVIFSGNVGTISNNAFLGNSVSSVIFKGDVTAIYAEAFYGSSLTTLTFKRPVQLFYGQYGYYWPAFNVLVFSNTALKTVYYPATWAIPSHIFPAGVTFIPHSFPFMACESHGRICNCKVVWTVTDSVDNIVDAVSNAAVSSVYDGIYRVKYFGAASSGVERSDQ
eukprot:gene22600-29260_t